VIDLGNELLAAAKDEKLLAILTIAEQTAILIMAASSLPGC